MAGARSWRREILLSFLLSDKTVSTWAMGMYRSSISRDLIRKGPISGPSRTAPGIFRCSSSLRPAGIYWMPSAARGAVHMFTSAGQVPVCKDMLVFWWVIPC